MPSLEFDLVQTVTVKDIASGVRRVGEKPQDVINRVRNWAKEGLLLPVGNKAPGTGRSLQYPRSAIATARGLSILSDIFDRPASSSRMVARFLANAKSFLADPPQGPAWLVMDRPPDEASWSLELCRSADELSAAMAQRDRLAFMVIDLQKYFDQLQPLEI